MPQLNSCTIVLRRHELIDLAIKEPLADAVKFIAEKYDTTPDTIYQDWQTRGVWLKDILKLDDPTLPTKHFLGLEKVIAECWYQYELSKGLGWLRLIKETHSVFLDLMVKAGLLTSALASDQYEEIRLSWANSKEELVKHTSA